jgi:hypothetical protein
MKNVRKQKRVNNEGENFSKKNQQMFNQKSPQSLRFDENHSFRTENLIHIPLSLFAFSIFS